MKATALNYTASQLSNIIEQAKEAAHKASMTYFNEVLNNVDQDERGIAWVEIRDVKGNTKLGKAMKAAGVSQDWQNVFRIWNTTAGLQSLAAQLVGSQAAADVLWCYGFTVHVGSR